MALHKRDSAGPSDDRRRARKRWTARIRRTMFVVGVASSCAPGVLHGQVITLSEAVSTAATQDRSIHIADLEREKAQRDVSVARTRRLPSFSVIALGSQPFRQLGITLERGSLGVYPHDGPIPGQTTTLVSPLRFGFIGYASVSQPLTQLYKIGLGIELAKAGVDATAEQLRAKRQGVVNEVRRLYYGIAQAESGKATLQAAVDFLRQLHLETRNQTLQRIALQADLLSVNAQLVEAEYELLKMEDPIQTQKEQLNRLMGRPIDVPLEIDLSSIVEGEPEALTDAYAEALSSRPEIRLAKVQQRKTQVERRLASAERIPDVSLSLQALRTVNFSSVFPNSVSGVGVQATWDVFDWGRKRKAVETKEAAEAQATLELRDVEARVMTDVAHQYRRIGEARKAVELAQALQSSNTEALRVARNRYLQREAVLSDVARIQSSLADANHRYTQALMDLATAQADFEKAIGRDR
jgi:outer membrane protein